MLPRFEKYNGGHVFSKLIENLTLIKLLLHLSKKKKNSE